jgi:V8-like Glu-specific endopeptidase
MKRIAFACLAALIAMAFLASSGLPAAAQGPRYPEMQMQVSTEGITPEQYLRRQDELNRSLVSELPPAALQAPIEARLTREEVLSVEEARGELPLKIGATKPLAPAIDLAGLSRSRPPQAGAIQRAADGGLVWSAVISSENAGAIRLHVQNMVLPGGAELFVYSRAGEAFGPWTGEGPNGDGDFWTTAVFGNEAIVHLRMPADADLGELRLQITEVGIITARFAAGLRPVEQAPPPRPPSFCGNASCIVDATCFNAGPAETAKDAVAKMEWIAGAFIYTCTGGLIADNNPNSSNFFLTANHCLSKNNNAANVTFYWQFATSTCNGTCPSNGSWTLKTTGSTVSATNRKGDFTLLHLNSNPPAGSVFLGWNSAPVANTNGAQLYRISNPNFGPQVYSQHTVDTSAPTCSGWPRGERIYSRDQDVDSATAGHQGATDGGSSGSPVVNSSSQIVGQLSGACGFNPSNPCAFADNATVDGAFAFYFATVRPFLNP